MSQLQTYHYLQLLTCTAYIYVYIHSRAVVKDEPPDAWDEDEPQEDEKEKLRRNDKDLDFLFQEVVRDNSLDDYLNRDLQSKQSNPKYTEMLVSYIKFYIYSSNSKSDGFVNPKRVFFIDILTVAWWFVWRYYSKDKWSMHHSKSIIGNHEEQRALSS